MNPYLVRLKDKFDSRSELTELTQAHPVSFVSDLGDSFSKAEAAIGSDPANACHGNSAVGDGLAQCADDVESEAMQLLLSNPEQQRAITTRSNADSGEVIVKIAIRGGGSCELAMTSDQYDPFKMLEMLRSVGFESR